MCKRNKVTVGAFSLIFLLTSMLPSSVYAEEIGVTVVPLVLNATVSLSTDIIINPNIDSENEEDIIKETNLSLTNNSSVPINVYVSDIGSNYNNTFIKYSNNKTINESKTIDWKTLGHDNTIKYIAFSISGKDIIPNNELLLAQLGTVFEEGNEMEMKVNVKTGYTWKSTDVLQRTYPITLILSINGEDISMSKLEGGSVEAGAGIHFMGEDFTVDVFGNSNGDKQSMEYAISKSNIVVPEVGWQDINAFPILDLDYNTQYYIWYRAAENESYIVGKAEVSEGFTTPKGNGGTVDVTNKRIWLDNNDIWAEGNFTTNTDQEFEFAISISMDVEDLDWYTAKHKTDSFHDIYFDNLEPATEYYLFVRTKANDNYNSGDIVFLGKCTTDLLSGAEVSVVPTLKYGLYSYLEVKPSEISENPGNQTIEYALVSNRHDGSVWQDSPIFTGNDILSGNYTVKARAKKNSKYDTGNEVVSGELRVSNYDADYVNISGSGRNGSRSITVDQIIPHWEREVEYCVFPSIDNSRNFSDYGEAKWQSSREFNDLLPTTRYECFYRLKPWLIFGYTEPVYMTYWLSYP